MQYEVLHAQEPGPSHTIMLHIGPGSARIGFAVLALHRARDAGLFLNRPVLRRNIGRIHAGEIGHRLMPPLLERIEQTALHLWQQSKSVKHQRTVKLDQRRAGLGSSPPAVSAVPMPPTPITGIGTSSRT